MVNMELIDKDDLLYSLKDLDTTVDKEFLLNNIIKKIRTFDVDDIRKGYWIEPEEMHYLNYCSNCGVRGVENERSPYCPHCGAKMLNY